MTERIVQCVKLGKPLPGLAKPPFGDQLGQEIYEKVSADAWALWKDDMMIKIINEYRLNLAETDHFSVLVQQMRAFLNLDGASEALEVENPDRGK